MLARRGELELLAKARELRPKEFSIMQAELKELLYKELSPEERIRYREDKLDLIHLELEMFEEEDPSLVGRTIADLKLETILAGLSPEKRKKLLELLLKQEQTPENKNLPPDN
jgi:5'-deoxynucleotidase YfbR-like HD superfamily hydrolase